VEDLTTLDLGVLTC